LGGTNSHFISSRFIFKALGNDSLVLFVLAFN
jgi:hypothetical protein